MTKSTKRSVVISALLAIIMCVSLIVGGTFAIFTSESKVNIAVTSGKVDVKAEISDFEVYSPTSISMESGNSIISDSNAASADTFANGGTATLEGGEVTLDRMTPGDKVTFKITITNYSNVAVNYRTVWMSSEDDGLFDGLTLKIGETVEGALVEKTYDGSTLYAKWATLEAATEDRSEVKTLSVTVELPTDKGNEYQDKKCKISFIVEAVQGNAHVDNFVAKIGENGYENLEEAVTALNGGQVGNTLEITRPGTYAPFTITLEGATVKGIIGEDRAHSTVIKNTATQNIKAHADNLTLQNLYIDTTACQITGVNDGGAIVTYNTSTRRVAENLTIDGCVMVGNGKGKAFLFSGETLTLTNNIFNNFEKAYEAMCDGSKPEKITITGNTFNNVKFAVDGYWGAAYNGDDFNFVITGNKMNGAVIHLWDYYQYGQFGKTSPATGAAVKAQIKGNIGDYSVILTHNNWFTDNGNDIEESAKVYYRRTVKFDVDSADYKVYNKDGSNIVAVMYDESTTLSGSTSNYYLYAITEGEYLVKNTKTGVIYPLVVEKNPIDKTQVFRPVAEGIALYDFAINEQNKKLTTRKYAISSANGLKYFRDMVATWDNDDNYKGWTVKLIDDINLNNELWKPIAWTHGTCPFIFDGNGKTVYGLYVNEVDSSGSRAGLFNEIEGGTVQNLTISGANVTGTYHTGAIAGRAADTKFIGCKVIDSTICSTVYNGNAGSKKVGAIVGYHDGIGTINNCEVSGCTVQGYLQVGGLVGYCKTETITNNKITDTRIINDRTVDYKKYDSLNKCEVGQLYGACETQVTASGNDVSGATIEEKTA